MKSLLKLLALIFLFCSCIGNEVVKEQDSDQLAKVNEYISSATYMHTCKNITSSTSISQVHYQGLMPGKTKREDVIPLVGRPNEITRVNEKIKINGEIQLIEDQWIYDNFILTVVNDTLYSIDIYDQDSVYKPLIDIIKKFGCPNIIFAVDQLNTSDENSDREESPVFTLLKYQKIGLELFFGERPIQTTDIPERITLRDLETLEDFLWRMKIFESSLGIKGIVSWDDAVVNVP